ncbi:hypothetical protein C8A00DRAFT_15215 [Chaetomidium leptoderma]|uniref:Mid2 domain-containing protein n=1 Tax=Chaetomidium leptoderma TaxID=669021 RepID=A0AAN6VNL0_9PEZI|nr:hypothetical protein C8A00DRAFT_15215 [Chaetomidium leptoderma]
MAKTSRYLSFLLLVSNVAFARARCYYPTSGVDGDFPCNPDAEESMCCGTGPGAMCLTNGACQRPGQDFIRGSCTDKTWASPECPSFCTLECMLSVCLLPAGSSIHSPDARAVIDQGMGPALISCANVTGRDTSFCCGNTNGCCDRGIERFELLPSNPEPFAIWNETISQYVAVTATTASTSTTASATTSTTATTTASTTSSPSSSATSLALPPGQTQPPESDRAESSGLSVAAQAGIGVGVSLCGILLGVIAYLLWKLYQNKRGANPEDNPRHYGDKQYPAPQCSGQVPQEMFADPAEMYGDSPYVELDGPQKPIEMAAGAMYR